MMAGLLLTAWLAFDQINNVTQRDMCRWSIQGPSWWWWPPFLGATCRWSRRSVIEWAAGTALLRRSPLALTQAAVLANYWIVRGRVMCASRADTQSTCAVSVQVSYGGQNYFHELMIKRKVCQITADSISIFHVLFHMSHSISHQELSNMKFCKVLTFQIRRNLMVQLLRLMKILTARAGHPSDTLRFVL